MIFFSLQERRFNRGKKWPASQFHYTVYGAIRKIIQNMYRDLGYYWLRLGIYIALGFALGTLFYEIGFEFDSISVSFMLKRSVCML
ncbi:hypothetical protein HanIR_Chr10g0479411 [Helianthus annuus]|nr:hypothetical protein HanIR_Chr10g0479411 [Helianthus annuus]